LSDVVSGTSTIGPLIGDTVADYALITTGDRSIGDIYPDVVVEEIHHDEMQITQHPVETGAPVTDHAFMMPYTIEIRGGWSNSSAESEGYVQAVYQALLTLQSSREVFNVSTGKRQYSSMLMRSVMVRTDEESENALMVVAIAQQIIITNTSSTAASSTTANTNGSATVATADVTDGTFTIEGGASPAEPGSMTVGTDGVYNFSNSPYSAGSQILSDVSSSTPTWAQQAESLSAPGL
jgi:hypothetical protein